MSIVLLFLKINTGRGLAWRSLDENLLGVEGWRWKLFVNGKRIFFSTLLLSLKSSGRK